MADFTERDITRGLNALVAFGGTPGPASRALKSTFDLDVSPGRLKTWRDHTYAERYVSLQVEHSEEIESAIIRETRDLARAAAIAERIAIESVLEQLDGGRLRAPEVAQVALNMSKIKQSNIDKMLALTGRPTAITEHRSAAEIIRALEAKGVLELGTNDDAR